MLQGGFRPRSDITDLIEWDDRSFNTYAEFDLRGLHLGIFQPKPESLVEFANSENSTMSICLEVADIAAISTHLTRMGYPPPGNIISASHGQEIYAYDPLGNRLILHQAKI